MKRDDPDGGDAHEWGCGLLSSDKLVGAYRLGGRNVQSVYSAEAECLGPLERRLTSERVIATGRAAARKKRA